MCICCLDLSIRATNNSTGMSDFYVFSSSQFTMNNVPQSTLFDFKIFALVLCLHE